MVYSIQKGKYNTRILKFNKPIVIKCSGTFERRFVHEKRHFAVVSDMRCSDATLNKMYEHVDLLVPNEIIIKLPYRYNKFECYVSENGVGSSVYSLQTKDVISFEVEHTSVQDGEISFKFNSINIMRD